MQRVIALGFFDGVHLGHAALLRRVRELANQYGCCAAALTLDTHPDALIRGESVPLLNTAEEREALMCSLYGMDEVLTLRFNHETMQQPWEEFVESTLFKTYRATHVVCGHDYRFGAGGAGNPEKLAKKSAALGIGCDCIPEIRIDEEAVSSTRIRNLLESGETAQAVRLLGHAHILSGTVVAGRQLGRTLGIPTANIALSEGLLLPKLGVYAAKAYFDGECRLAVVNIGTRPTVGGHHVTVEPWLLDFDGDLYGQTLRLELYHFLRGEKKFESLDAMRDEIRQNANQTKAFFDKTASL